FFQAEDGIRDFHVTGVQTCALPICQRYGFKLAMGRNKEAVEWRSSPNNEEHYFVLVPGRTVLDGIDTLKSASYHFESFSLEFVRSEERRVGKECRSRWWRYRDRRNE